jgi:hypothetical protein
MNAAAQDTVLLTIAGVIAALAAIPPGAPYRRTAIVVCLALVVGAIYAFTRPDTPEPQPPINMEPSSTEPPPSITAPPPAGT